MHFLPAPPEPPPTCGPCGSGTDGMNCTLGSEVPTGLFALIAEEGESALSPGGVSMAEGVAALASVAAPAWWAATGGGTLTGAAVLLVSPVGGWLGATEPWT
mmetsp:Transcript_6976/g.15940  ORF Transcript_6976/g.15940 Transcript_6976/m.15940 type:complete len:102 (-) Transcript_6976:388-693(-)